MDLQQHAARILNVLLDLYKELHSLPAIQQAMVIGQSQVHHWPDLNLSVDGNRRILDGMQTQHGSLRQIDDRGTHQGTKDTAIANSESTSSHILDSELAITRLARC